MRAATSIAIAVIAAAPAQAFADEASDAFDRGRALLSTGSIAEACAAFQRSMDLDPQHGTLYNLANCQARRGQVATAWRAYRTLVERDGNAKRRDDAARRAAALEPSLARLRIVATTPGWTATLDDEDVTGALNDAAPVDPGERLLVARHADGRSHRETVRIAAGAVATVRIDAPRPRSARDARRQLAQVAWIGGAALAATGLAFGVNAAGLWGDATDVCGGDTRCPNVVAFARATELGDRARSHASVATALVLVGGAAIGLGVWYRRRATSAYVAPGTEASPIGLTVGGHF